ncbi:MAG: NADP-dependent oxidoreductase, partial [Gammaproteobacteria bacterium]
RARMQGFFVFDYEQEFETAGVLLEKWYAGGELRPCEDITEGLENMPLALQGLFTGSNRGVSVCQVGAATHHA